MELIFIYGAPATGKYTVAKALQDKTGYKLFHNHLTADLAGSIFESGTIQYSELATSIRLQIIELCVKNKLSGLIMTYAYGLETFEGKYDDDFIKKMININKTGKTVFVKLECSKEEQLKRLNLPSRKEFKKLTDKNILENIEAKHKTDKTVPFVDSFVIDDSTLSPEETVKKILNHVLE
jgi:dephospho-CoA kinase